MTDNTHTDNTDSKAETDTRAERKPPATPAGHTTADETAESADEETSVEEDEQDEDTATTDDGNQQFRQTVGDIDHSSPVAGPNRTFKRGNEDHVDTE